MEVHGNSPLVNKRVGDIVPKEIEDFNLTRRTLDQEITKEALLQIEDLEEARTKFR